MGYHEDENKNLLVDDKSPVSCRLLTKSITDQKPDHLIDDQQEYDEDLSKDFQGSWRDQELKWSNIFILSILHLAVILSYIYVSLNYVKPQTTRFGLAIGFGSGLGMSVGGHRLWAHKSFKARWPLKVLLLILQTMTMNGSAYSYARDHRVHHKHSDTKYDPKNPGRGIFYSHIGWWMLKKTDDVKKAGSRFDFSDLQNDPLLRFQHRYYVPLFIIFSVILPVVIPVYFWKEEPLIAFCSCVVLRIFVILHHLFTVNSITHFFGNRPYDFRIRPTDQRFINYISFGEGNHNYHHVFPYDYRSNERTQWETFNPVIATILFFEAIGLVYDKKIASPNVVEGTIRRKGVLALHDRPERNLLLRIILAFIDWTMGFIVDLWPLYIPLVFKLLTGRPFQI